MYYPLATPWGLALLVLYLTGFLVEWVAVRRLKRNPGKPQLRGNPRLDVLLDVAEVVYLPARKSAAAESDSHTRAILVTGTFFGLSAALIAPILLPTTVVAETASFLRPAGLSVALLGVMLRHASIKELGPCAIRVAYVQKGLPLVTSGPYRYIRNPAYAGSLLLYSGTGMVVGSWLSPLLALLLPLVTRIPRIMREETLLLEVHGEAYTEYASRVKRLLPRIW